MWSAPHQVRAARSEPVNIGMITNAGGQMVTAPPHTPWLAPAVPNGATRLHQAPWLLARLPSRHHSHRLRRATLPRLTRRRCAFPPRFSRRPSSGLTIAPSVCSCRPAAARRRVSRTATTYMRTVIEHQPDATHGSPTPASHDEKASIIQNGKPKTSLDDTEKEKDKDKSAGKKVQKMLKNRVHKEQRRISMIGRKIEHGVGKLRGGLTLRRTSSTPSEYFSSLLLIWGTVLTSLQPTCTRHWESTRRRTKRLLFILVGTALYASTNELIRPESPHPLPPPSLTPRERKE